MFRRLRPILLCASLVSAALAGDPPPRYIFLNIAPGAGHGYATEALGPEMLLRVKQTIGAEDNPKLRIGVSYVFSTMEAPAPKLAEDLRRLLAASEQTGVPVMVALDGQNWWNSRPDLWNWWNPDAPGYNPDNVFHVEWTGWNPSNAVKICWRNWGSQLRVPPPPNLAHPRIIEEHLRPLRTLIPVLAEWQKRLPDSKKWLFPGVKLGWESGIGYNAYHYPGGNRFAEQWPADASHDPKHSLDMEKGLSGGLCQLGHAAVKTAGIRKSGDITRDDLAQVTRDYLARLCRTAADAGMPRRFIFTHQGGNYAPWEQHLPFHPAVNRWSNPGWSFYGTDPHDIPLLASDLKKTGRTRWAASEWWWGAPDAAGWEDHFRRTLEFRDCRFICVYNWTRSFEKDAAGHEALRRLVNTWDK